MLMEVDGRSHGRTKSWRKLTEGPADAQKVDGSSEGSADAPKLTDGTSEVR